MFTETKGFYLGVTRVSIEGIVLLYARLLDNLKCLSVFCVCVLYYVSAG